VYGFPKQRAAEIAVSQVHAHGAAMEELLFVCFDTETATIYRELLRNTRRS
jgi:O-acetyl-ADP-ribose deacetylase (regulator of RNase III)